MNEISRRKGASSPSNVPDNILEMINSGSIPTVNLGESLATDNLGLLEKILDYNGMNYDTSALRADKENSKLMTCYKNIGLFLLRNLSETELAVFAAHVSDIARCWACLAFGYMPVPFTEKMELIRPFADDVHMGVREMAWMALRDDIAANPVAAVELLMPWTLDDSANIRRCASEATRPRGVWCRHVNYLKEKPETGLPLLEPLKADSSKYVRDSVANWLNDASKSKPEWVIAVTDRWLKESPFPETEKICKRALRTLRKQDK